jgi:hypothetical protein
MKFKIIISVVAVVVILSGLFFYVKNFKTAADLQEQAQIEGPDQVSPDNEAVPEVAAEGEIAVESEPGQEPSAVDGELAEWATPSEQETKVPVEPDVSEAVRATMPIAIIIEDDVLVQKNETAAEDNRIGAMEQNSGNHIFISEESSIKKGLFKVVNSDGKTGWLDSKNFIVIPKLKDISSFYSSTKATSEIIPKSEIKTEEMRRKVAIFSSEDFLQRARNNDNEEVSKWASELIIKAEAVEIPKAD